MRNIKKLVYMLVILPLLYANTAHSMSQSDAQVEAESVVKAYHFALTQGDTVTIKSLFGGDLLIKRRRLLDNPTYPSHLIEVYGGSTIVITRNISSNDSITIDADITLKTGEIQQRRYLLKRNTDSASTYGYNIISDTSREEDI
jgi:hypothetical protein